MLVRVHGVINGKCLYNSFDVVIVYAGIVFFRVRLTWLIYSSDLRSMISRLFECDYISSQRWIFPL